MSPRARRKRADESRVRCPWVDLTKPDYASYHDKEWGVPIVDDQTLFEYLTLEGAQAGLSWYTVLCKRDHYRDAFKGFDPQRVARMTAREIDKLTLNAGLIRHRQKLASTVTNARAFLEIQEEFGAAFLYFWSFMHGREQSSPPRTLKDYPAQTTISDELSKDLKRRGFKFVGSTIMYAFMQATGLVNDHSVTCFRRTQIKPPKLNQKKLQAAYELRAGRALK